MIDEILVRNTFNLRMREILESNEIFNKYVNLRELNFKAFLQTKRVIFNFPIEVFEETIYDPKGNRPSDIEILKKVFTNNVFYFQIERNKS